MRRRYQSGTRRMCCPSGRQVPRGRVTRWRWTCLRGTSWWLTTGGHVAGEPYGRAEPSSEYLYRLPRLATLTSSADHRLGEGKLGEQSSHHGAGVAVRALREGSVEPWQNGGGACQAKKTVSEAIIPPTVTPPPCIDGTWGREADLEGTQGGHDGF